MDVSEVGRAGEGCKNQKLNGNFNEKLFFNAHP